jgi:hypothetical protein
MKLIIDIPKEEWLFTKAKIVSEDDSYVDRAVANGIPLDKINDEVNKLKKVSDGNKVYVGINDVFDIIDKYKGDKE